MSQNDKKTIHNINQDDNNSEDRELKLDESVSGVISSNDDEDNVGQNKSILDTNNNNRPNSKQHEQVNERSRQLQSQQFQDQSKNKISIREEEELMEEAEVEKDNDGAINISNSKQDLKLGNF